MINPIAWLLVLSLSYLVVTSLILAKNRFDFIPLSYGKQSTYRPKISVCIPARNEERNITRLLDSLTAQEYPDYEIHVLDDRSTDNTETVAGLYAAKQPARVHLHKGKPKPDEWLGKPWACHQLSGFADGEILLFLDADTVVQGGFFHRIAASFAEHRTDMLTVWPRQQTGTFWERVVIPLVYYALVTLLPVIYVYRDPGWLPKPLKEKLRPLFAAACGQCIACKAEAYQAAGGHRAVKTQVVEDVMLAKQVKRAGLRLRMFHGVGAISCRMYRNEQEMFDGFRKNFFAGFGNSFLLFLLAMVMHLVVFVLPFVALIVSLFTADTTLFFLSASAITLILCHRLILAQWFRMNPVYSLTHPLGVVWFLRLGVVKIFDHLFQKNVLWKGRKI